MEITTRGVHYEISERTKKHLDKKLQRLSFAEHDIIDADISISKEHHDYVLNFNIHLKWGLKDHIRVENRDLYDGIDLLMEKTATKIRREKEKKMDNHHI